MPNHVQEVVERPVSKSAQLRPSKWKQIFLKRTSCAYEYFCRSSKTSTISEDGLSAILKKGARFAVGLKHFSIYITCRRASREDTNAKAPSSKGA